MERVILKVSTDKYEPSIRMVKPDELPADIHAVGCGIVSVETRKYDEYQNAVATIILFEHEVRALAEAEFESAKEYGDVL